MCNGKKRNYVEEALQCQLRTNKSNQNNEQEKWIERKNNILANKGKESEAYEEVEQQCLMIEKHTNTQTKTNKQHKQEHESARGRKRLGNMVWWCAIWNGNSRKDTKRTEKQQRNEAYQEEEPRPHHNFWLDVTDFSKQLAMKQFHYLS